VLSEGLVLLTSVGAETLVGAKKKILDHIFILLCSYLLYKILYKTSGVFVFIVIMM
jgi:hypothetical protein